MAQLNPNFEIDFNDINSYEQVQLINDTQLAKENLLMHKAYKEPAEDEIIRNQFSSFTFVDFCPKLFNSAPKSTPTNDRSTSPTSPRHHQYVLETFSDLFDRINMWLKVNRDWRVISMETLIFDCASQFNHLKSSIHSANLPRNTRGLRLYLSPTKSRFSGPQKIGCINVIPRKTSRQHDNGDKVYEYETLDQILARLNDLLLTRPIEGRILSVETITLPIVNGYVNTETNYFMDIRLNALSQRIYNHANDSANRADSIPKEPAAPAASAESGNQRVSAANGDCQATSRVQQPNGLIDTLRVYYEFGPRVCGLVNLIDFLPQFNFRQPVACSTVASPTPDRDSDKARDSGGDDSSQSSGCEDKPQQPTLSAPLVEQLDIDSTESLTRLIGRSLNWFENERKTVMAEGMQIATSTSGEDEDSAETSSSSDTELPSSDASLRAAVRRKQVNLKVCNLQIHTKVLLKSRLAKVTPQTALDVVRSRQMFHEPPGEPIVCHLCGLSSAKHEPQEWCTHLVDLNQPLELKFVRLAYVVPVYEGHPTRFTRSLRSLPSLQSSRSTPNNMAGPERLEQSRPANQNGDDPATARKSESSSEEGNADQSHSSSRTSSNHEDDEGDDDEDEEIGDDEGDEVISEILAAQQSAEKLAKEASLEIVNRTNERHKRYERLHQLNEEADCSDGACTSPEPGQLIGQLTYRLFAPCQLVNSSSCFSINPVNSSNPLARRGSVVSDGGSCSDNATPSTLLLPASGLAGESPSGSTFTIDTALDHQPQPQQQIISFGAFFPALAHDTILSAHSNQKLGLPGQPHASKSSYRFAMNEFESVEAIRRRMEVYVTTNSMKVIAGETLVVNLSDHLSCLSNAIEQTIIKAPFGATRQPSTWVSVYVLYAAVDEPHLPSQLLEQQKLRERLQLISEADEDEEQALEEATDASRAGQGQDVSDSTGERNMVPVFDDDFKCEQQPSAKDQSQHPDGGGVAVSPVASRQQRIASISQTSEQQQPRALASTLASLNLENGSIRVELSRSLSNQTDLAPYNSAYDRTVALPTQPDDHLTNYLEPVDLNLAGSWANQQQQQQPPPSAGNVWLDEIDLIEVRSYQLSNSNVRDASKSLRMRQQQQQQLHQAKLDGPDSSASILRDRTRKGKKRRSRARRTGEHSQCSIM